MALYVVVNDVHLADRPPSACTETYQDDLFDLLEAVGSAADDLDAAAVVFSGDVFHNKTPARTTHRTLIRLIELLRGWPVPALIVPGNHDLSHDRLASLESTQPLGVVFASGAATLLNGWSALDEGLISDPVYGVPWLPHFDDGSVCDALKQWRARPDLRPGLVVAHAPLYPPGRELAYENYPASNWAEFMDGNGTVIYGHVHEDHGLFECGGVRFCNPGALSRGSLHEHNLTRGIKVSVWDSQTGRVVLMSLDAKPASEVFALQAAAEQADSKIRLDEFLARVGQTRLSVTSIESIIEQIRGLKLGDRLQEIVEDLLRENPR
jgi:hypothetical protein